MMLYLIAPAYVLGVMAVILLPIRTAPYTGPAPDWFSKPALQLAKADRHPPAPAIAEVPEKIQTRLVSVETIKVSTNLIPPSCVKLAAREGEALPLTEKQVRDAKAKVDRLARGKGDSLARACQRDMKENRT